MCWASKEREALVEGTPHTRDRYGSPSQTSEDADPCESQVVSHFCQHADLAQSFQNLLNFEARKVMSHADLAVD